MTVGETFGPYLYEVTEMLVDGYRRAVGDQAIERIDGESVAPTTLLTFPVLQLTSTRWRQRPGGVHAAQTFETLAPIRVPCVLSITGQLTEMYLRRGRRYSVVEASVRDDRGVEVARARTVGLYPGEDLGDADVTVNPIAAQQVVAEVAG